MAGVIGVTLVMGSCQVGRLCHYYEFQAHRWSLHGCYSPESVLVRRTTCGMGTNRVDLFVLYRQGKDDDRVLSSGICDIPRVVDDTEVFRFSWVQSTTSAECKLFE